MIASALGRCRRIGLRDKVSLAWALEHMSDECRGRLILEDDLALRIPSASPARIAFLCKRFSLLPPPKGTAANGFGLITLRGDVKPGYLKIFLSWVSILRAEGIRLLIVPMYPKEDGRICRKVSSLLGIRMAEGLSPSDLVGLASRARIVCGMRLHSLIFAAAAGTPFVGFGSDPKIEAFCREHGGVFFTDLY
jgi:polysaccharide pyruvyl transferase WcaK-like protein